MQHLIQFRCKHVGLLSWASISEGSSTQLQVCWQCRTLQNRSELINVLTCYAPVPLVGLVLITASFQWMFVSIVMMMMIFPYSAVWKVCFSFETFSWFMSNVWKLEPPPSLVYFWVFPEFGFVLKEKKTGCMFWTPFLLYVSHLFSSLWAAMFDRFYNALILHDVWLLKVTTSSSFLPLSSMKLYCLGCIFKHNDGRFKSQTVVWGSDWAQ